MKKTAFMQNILSMILLLVLLLSFWAIPRTAQAVTIKTGILDEETSVFISADSSVSYSFKPSESGNYEVYLPWFDCENCGLSAHHFQVDSVYGNGTDVPVAAEGYYSDGYYSVYTLTSGITYTISIWNVDDHDLTGRFTLRKYTESIHLPSDDPSEPTEIIASGKCGNNVNWATSMYCWRLAEGQPSMPPNLWQREHVWITTPGIFSTKSGLQSKKHYLS